jgi:hypothetical protein
MLSIQLVGYGKTEVKGGIKKMEGKNLYYFEWTLPHIAGLIVIATGIAAMLRGDSGLASTCVATGIGAVTAGEGLATYWDTHGGDTKERSKTNAGA